MKLKQEKRGHKPGRKDSPSTKGGKGRGNKGKSKLQLSKRDISAIATAVAAVQQDGNAESSEESDEEIPIKPNKSSSTRWRIASLKRHYRVTSVVKVQSKKSEDPDSVGSFDPINVNICIKPIMGSYLQLPNALSVAAHLGTILGLIALAKWSTLNGHVR